MDTDADGLTDWEEIQAGHAPVVVATERLDFLGAGPGLAPTRHLARDPPEGAGRRLERVARVAAMEIAPLEDSPRVAGQTRLGQIRRSCEEDGSGADRLHVNHGGSLLRRDGPY